MELGEFSYTAYGFNRNWKTYDDKPMPKWEDLTPEIQAAWAYVEQANAEKFSPKIKLSKRDFAEVTLASKYVEEFNHGTSGHLAYQVMAKLYKAILEADGQVTVNDL